MKSQVNLIRIVSIIRPVNVLLTLSAVFTGAFLVYLDSNEFILWRTILAGFSASLMAAGIYILNDLHDIVEDRINRPDRIINQGSLNTKTVRNVSLIIILISLISAIPLGLSICLFTLLILALLLLYVYRFKSYPLAGNFLVALCAAASFPFGALANGNFSAGLIPAFLALPVHFIREIFKDVEDQEGDRIAGHRSLPIVTSVYFTIRFAGLIMLVTAMALPIPFFAGKLNLLYLLISSFTVSLPLAYQAGAAIAFPEKFSSVKAQKLLKIIMLPGMISIILGSL